jgi:hypothetical protein
MMLLVLTALYLAASGRWTASLPVMTAAALLKFIPFVLVPVLVWKGRGNPAALIGGAALSLALVIALYAPLWAGLDTFDGVRDQGSRMTSSLAALGAFVMPDAWLRPLAVALFTFGFITVMRRDLDLPATAFAVMLLYLLVLSFWTKEWYFTSLVALGAVAGGKAFWITIPGVALLLMATVFGGWAWEMNWLSWQERWGTPAMELCLTATTLGGWLGVLGVIALRARRAAAARGASALLGLAQRSSGQGPANTTA